MNDDINAEKPQKFEQTLPPYVYEVMDINPKIILGSSGLFEYDPLNHTIKLSSCTIKLFERLAKLKAISSEVLNAHCLKDLNLALQVPFGDGGLIRKSGVERWHLKDSPALIKHRSEILHLINQIGFNHIHTLKDHHLVNHCIIFGGTAARIKKRILETLSYLKTQVSVSDKIFLLGSNRKLTQNELEHINKYLSKWDDPQKNEWVEKFSHLNEQTEANSLVFLWKFLTPIDLQHQYNDQITLLNSTRYGASYDNTKGHRATTITTIEDLLSYIDKEAKQSFFAVCEQPYTRVFDQLMFTILTNKRTLTNDQIIKKYQNTDFLFVTTKRNPDILILTILDEIARNVYTINQNYNFF